MIKPPSLVESATTRIDRHPSFRSFGTGRDRPSKRGVRSAFGSPHDQKGLKDLGLGLRFDARRADRAVMPNRGRTRQVPHPFAVVGRAWREGWAALSAPLVRASLVIVLGVAAVGSLVLGAQLGSTDALSLLSDVVIPLVSVGAAALLVVAASHRRGGGVGAGGLVGIWVWFFGAGGVVWGF